MPVVVVVVVVLVVVPLMVMLVVDHYWMRLAHLAPVLVVQWVDALVVVVD